MSCCADTLCAYVCLFSYNNIYDGKKRRRRKWQRKTKLWLDE